MQPTGNTDRKRLQRIWLRAANGAGGGALLGGLLGFVLGGASAFAVGLATGEGLSCHYVRYWPFCALAGLPPGLGGGALLGALLVVRDDRRRSRLAALIGLACGLAWALLYRSRESEPVLIAMSVCGLIGGVVMALVLWGVRRRWSWWSRWENNHS